MGMDIIILGIESSCDDTSAAIIRNGFVASNRVANQDVHKKYGGVVPELASRAHQKNIIPVVDVAIKEAGINPSRYLCGCLYKRTWFAGIPFGGYKLCQRIFIG
jgi:tRNA A37 threonylcarbamoyltransferase TsaD